MSEQLDAMKSALMTCAIGRMNDLENTDAKELGEVIDMIKDLEEAKYYCSITEAMEKRSKSDGVQEKIDSALMMERLRNQSESQPMDSNYYGGPYYRYSAYPMYGYEERNRMYYDGRDEPRGTSHTTTPVHIRDSREGRSYMSRKGYMESSESHMPESVKMEKLDEYVKELGSDITDMIRDASPTEKQTLRDKLMRIAEQIV